MTAYRQTIRVIYPQDDGQIVLRTERIGMQMSKPVSRRGCTSKFPDRNRATIFLFQTGSDSRWRDGVVAREKIVLRSQRQVRLLEIHPFFREDTRCSVCELMPPLASPSGVEHRFRVFLPPGYHENTLKRYPVLYMHDGHNLFLKEEAFVGNTWRTDEVLNMLDKMNAIEEVIVVGIHPNDRMDEYTMPGYEDYGRFLVERLKPLIDGKYRTLTAQQIPPPWDPRSEALFHFISDGNGQRSSAKWPVFRAHSRIGTICSIRVSSEPKRKIRIYLDSGWPRRQLRSHA